MVTCTDCGIDLCQFLDRSDSQCCLCWNKDPLNTYYECEYCKIRRLKQEALNKHPKLLEYFKCQKWTS